MQADIFGTFAIERFTVCSTTCQDPRSKILMGTSGANQGGWQNVSDSFSVDKHASSVVVVNVFVAGLRCKNLRAAPVSIRLTCRHGWYVMSLIVIVSGSAEETLSTE